MPGSIERQVSTLKTKLQGLKEQGRLIRNCYLGDLSPQMHTVLTNLGASYDISPPVLSAYECTSNQPAFLLDWKPKEPLQTRALDIEPFYNNQLLAVTIRHHPDRAFHTALYDSAGRLPTIFPADDPSIETAKRVGESIINQSPLKQLALIDDLIKLMTWNQPHH